MLFRSKAAPHTGGGVNRDERNEGLLTAWCQDGILTVMTTDLSTLRIVPATPADVPHIVRFINDILLSAPSIVIGLFVYAVVVAKMRSFSGMAGVIALALLVIPVVIRTTENMLRLVPGSLREAAFALGAPRWKVSLMITLRAARSGVITGLLLALARIRPFFSPSSLPL